MKKHFLAGSIALALSGSLLAEMTIEETAVIAERGSALAPSGWSVSVIDAETLEIQQAEHIQQLLSIVPGVNIQRGNGMEYLPSLRSPVLTGAGACGSLAMMEEGIRLRGAGFCNVNELFDAHSEQAQSVEVLRGAASAFHGANTLLGAIDVRLGVQDQTAIRIDASDQGFKRLRLQTAYGEAGNKGAVYLTTVDDNGWRDQSGVQQQKFSWRHEADVSGWRLAPGLTAVNLNQETAGFITGKDAFKDDRRAQSNENPEAYRDSQVFRTWLHASTELTPQLKLQVSPYLRHTDMAFLQHFLPGDPLEENTQTGFGVLTTINQSLSDTWQLNYGLDVEATEASLKQGQDQPTQGSPFLVATIPQGLHYDYDVDASTVAGFVQLNANLAQYWHLSFGLRGETISYDYTNHLPVGRTREDGTECGFGGCRYSRPANRSDRFTQFSPNIAVRYEQGDWQFFSSAGQSFRPPQATELYRLQRGQQVANLDNVQANHFNIGFERQYDVGRLRLEAYAQRFNNLIIRDVNFFNVGDAKARSVGAELSWDQSFGDVTSSLVMNWASHEYDDNQFLARDENDNPVGLSGNDIDTAPHLFGYWQLQWQASDQLLLQTQWQYTSGYYLEPQNEHRYNGHRVWHAVAHYQLNEALKLRLRVDNVLDDAYASRADYTGFSGYRYFPGAPRTVTLGVDYQF